MPEFRWDETDLIEYLGVLPTIDEYETGHHFVVRRGDMRLELSIYQYDAEVRLSLVREGSPAPLVTVRLIDCPEVRLMRNRERPDFLEFAAGRVFGERYDRAPVITMGLRLAVDPDIAIALY
jgi:hypothetical protein